MQELTAGQPVQSGAAWTPTALAELDLRASKAAAGLPAVLQEGRDRYKHRNESKLQSARAAAARKRQAEAAASIAPSAGAAASKRRPVAAGAAAASATAEACSAEPAEPQSGSWSFFAHSRRACLAAILGVGVSLPSPAADVQAFLARLWGLTSRGGIDEAAAVVAAEAELARWEGREMAYDD